MNNQSYNNNQNICKDCIFRFRRLFIPINPENFVDEEDIQFLEGDESIVIMNTCIVSDMDLGLDSTIDCTHYKCKNETSVSDKISIFKHLNKD